MLWPTPLFRAVTALQVCIFRPNPGQGQLQWLPGTLSACPGFVVHSQLALLPCRLAKEAGLGTLWISEARPGKADPWHLPWLMVDATTPLDKSGHRNTVCNSAHPWLGLTSWPHYQLAEGLGVVWAVNMLYQWLTPSAAAAAIANSSDLYRTSFWREGYTSKIGP